MDYKIKRFSKKYLNEILESSDEYAINKFNEYDKRKVFILIKNKVIGWYHLDLAKNINHASYLYIYILKEYRNSGIGTEIYQRLLSKLMEASNSWWSEYDPNINTDNFCKKIDFDYTSSNSLLEYNGEKIEDTFFNIRGYQDKDFEIASKIWISEYEKMHQSIGIKVKKQKRNYQEMRKQYQKNKNDIYVVEYKGDVIGMGQIFEEGIGIGSIAIDSKYQNKGFGKQLISFLTNECIKRGVRKPILYCESLNIKAMNLYQQIGYKEIKRESVAVKYVDK